MSEEKLSIDLIQSEDVIVAVCKGEIDAVTAELLNKKVGAQVRSRNKKIAVDLSGVTFINSRGMGMLIEFNRQTKLGTGKFVICGAAPAVLHSLQQLGIPSLIRVFATREDAVSALQKKGLSIESRTSGNVIVVQATGAVDAFYVEGFDQAVRKQITEGAQTATLLNCSRIMYMNSRAIGALLDYHKMSEKAGKKFALCEIDARVLKVIQQLGIDTLLRIYPSEQEALQALQA
ncbi:MAG: anti-sigma factor antagonist [Kiritimatiellia bacterium]